MSAVGFGGIPIQRVSDDEAVRTIHAALDVGVTFIDTAAGYADSQKKIGLAIRGRRDGLVIATKSGQKTKKGMLQDVEQARQEMGLDVIDLYQFHLVSSSDAWETIRAPGGALEGLLEARDRGRIAHIGFSAHSLDVALELVDDPVFETIQFPFNLVTSEPKEKLIPKSRDKDLGFIVMKPLCGGQYHDAELAFKFLNGFPDLIPVPGIERPEEIEQIAKIVDSGATLEGNDKKRATQISTELGKRFCRRCGYCDPCPNGVPIQLAMLLDSFVIRFNKESMISGFAKRIAEDGVNCLECGECESKCPYELPIMETIKRSVEEAKKLWKGS